MPWQLTSDRPIYLQLLERLQLEILSGRYPPGERLPSVRDLAVAAAVNVNTMQRALAELEQLELVNTHRTTGRYITTDTARIRTLRDAFAQQHAWTYLQGMQQLGFPAEDALTHLHDVLTQHHKEN